MIKSRKTIFIVAIIFVIAASIITSFFIELPVNYSNEPIADTLATDTAEKIIPLPPKVEYEIVTDSFVVVKGKINGGQTLSDILLKHNISATRVDSLVKINREKNIFRQNFITKGNHFTVFCLKDSLQTARYFIYEENKTDYLVFDLGSSLNIYRKSKPIVSVVREINGTINSSLYQALSDQNTDPIVAMMLSEIYAWSIDFYRLQKGDQFKALVKENFVEGKSIGIENIIAADFCHEGADFQAFSFTQSGKQEYFDAQGNSLRKAFLKSPIKFSRISSGYSLKRFHPVQKINKPHLGTDYAAPYGTPVMAVGDGIVQEARHKLYNGNYVLIRHNGTYSTQYLHLQKIKQGMRYGARVKQGDVIGYVGSTGLATGPHVCFRFWKNGKQVNPLKQIIPPGKAVDKESFEQFVSVRDSLMNLFNPGNAL
jgi:murein DD-endopeptidase MepM/ murein hydrolase activator NlpD